MNRILKINDLAQARYELRKIGVSSRGIEVMAPKALGAVIKLTGVKVGAANIIKQEMLSIGGDAAVARGVVEGSEKISDLVILGNRDKVSKLIRKLHNQNIFGLDRIRADLEKLLELISDQQIRELNCRGRILKLDRLRIMGVLNVTPDSFSDGGSYDNLPRAVARAEEMIEAGVDLIDIGGESTRPGSVRVGVEEELRRVIPVIEAVRKITDLPLSIDTCKEQVARAAVSAGADLVNDISALRFDREMIDLLKQEKDLPVILMHMQGTPETMQKDPRYEDTIQNILDFFGQRLQHCLEQGIGRERIIIDPGIGFGKRHGDNLVILKKINEFKALGLPVLLGASRKSFIGRIYDSKPSERLEGSLAAAVYAFSGKIDMIRVHDVRSHKRFLSVLKQIEDSHEFSGS